MPAPLPPLPDDFRWTTESWGPALRCRSIEPLATHLFTTRQLQLPHEDGWKALGAALGVEPGRVVRVRQVHGKRVVVARAGVSGASGAAVEEADALISADPSIAIAVMAADCVPLLMADRRSGAVAAVHAGWRGTAAGITTVAVEAMASEFGSAPADLVAAIGPNIGACCYEVGPELVDAFAAAGHARHLIQRWFLAPPPRRSEVGVSSAALRLDVAGANRDQLILAGVPETQILTAGLCTAMHLELLTSYRAEREGAQRIAGAIRARG